MEAARIYLLRHGEVVNPRGVFYSQHDVSLTERGEEQSRQAARYLADMGVSEVISSDLGRCRYLAERLGELVNVKPLFTVDLREVHFGIWSGLTWEEIEAGYPGEFERRMKDMTGFRPPQGENLSDVQARVMPVIKKAAEENMGRSVAVIAHGGVNRVILATMLGMPLENIFSIEQDHACLNIVESFPDGVYVIKGLNISVLS